MDNSTKTLLIAISLVVIIIGGFQYLSKDTNNSDSEFIEPTYEFEYIDMKPYGTEFKIILDSGSAGYYSAYINDAAILMNDEYVHYYSGNHSEMYFSVSNVGFDGYELLQNIQLRFTESSELPDRLLIDYYVDYIDDSMIDRICISIRFDAPRVGVIYCTVDGKEPDFIANLYSPFYQEDSNFRTYLIRTQYNELELLNHIEFYFDNVKGYMTYDDYSFW